MRLIGCDLHASQQTIAMLDRDTGEVVEKTLKHEGEAVREFYAAIPPPVVVGIEATGSMGWFLRLMEELAIDVSRGASRGDPQGGDAPAETRSTRCGAVAAAAGGGSVSGDLDAVDRAAGSAGVAPAPPSMGAHADARAERAARDRAGARRAARPHAVESRGPGDARVVAAAAAHGASPQ